MNTLKPMGQILEETQSATDAYFTDNARAVSTYGRGASIAFKPQHAYYGAMGDGWRVGALQPDGRIRLHLIWFDPNKSTGQPYDARPDELAMPARMADRRAFRDFIYDRVRVTA